ncbi:MAG: Hsp20/alpha crystallin family protein [Candidatus Dadabacteria bacterium]|nr:MAG: Hsp20/alpha crystallin family protein [Candidatus Dadabacteria bacterium]
MNNLPGTMTAERRPRSLFPLADTLISDFFTSPLWEAGRQVMHRSFPVDILETDKDYVLKADMPGVREEDLDITLENEVLTIALKHKGEVEKEEEGTYHYRERSFSSVSRSFKLPSIADDANIEAELKDGVLQLRIPKLPEKQARKISVKKK